MVGRLAWATAVAAVFLGISTVWVGAQQQVSQGSIEPGQSVEGRLQSGQEHVYTVEILEGGRVVIEMDRIDGSIDPYLELYTMNNSEIETNDDGGRGFNSQIVRDLDAGRYRIVARDFGRDDSGRYRLAVNARGSGPTVSGIPIEVGESLSGYITSGEPQRFVLELSEDQRVQIDLERADDSNIDPYLELADQFGLPITANDDGGQGFNSRISTFLDEGQYQIIASDLGDNDNGGFRLTVVGEGSDPIDGIPIAVGETLDSHITAGEPQYFVLELDREQTLQIDMLRDEAGSIDPYLVLADEYGAEIEYDDDGGDGFNSRIRRTLEPGRYTLIARDLANSRSGPFQLSVVEGTRADTIPISVGQRYDGYLNPGQSYAYLLELEQDRTVTIEFRRTGSADFDPYMILSDARGNRITSDDDSGGELNSRIERSLEAGRYLIEVSDVFDSNGGSFRISVE
ncbi:MAG: hypothetical protein ACOCYB_07840 [Alkalispirochaeta sp.]